ncbi:MAG TPA: hypothetical protein VN513_09860 [Gemmatimonadales bacterium]|nr:hypothetical protein [Gemmatimonadales bacterium]
MATAAKETVLRQVNPVHVEHLIESLKAKLIQERNGECGHASAAGGCEIIACAEAQTNRALEKLVRYLSPEQPLESAMAEVAQ